jgi:imidazolonepropionase-like amidohydrolase
MWELQELTWIGMTPMEAIVAGTKGTAEAYRLDDIGTLVPGNRADAIIVACDPLEDISGLYEQDNINVVIKDGRVESTDEAHKEHYRVREDQPEDRFQG